MVKHDSPKPYQGAVMVKHDGRNPCQAAFGERLAPRDKSAYPPLPLPLPLPLLLRSRARSSRFPDSPSAARRCARDAGSG